MAAAYTKEQLLSRLQELQIEFAIYSHPVVMTVEAQAKHIGHLGGGLSKNLFLKDKKHRYYIVSALAGTSVDMKVLSQRLGLGKGGLRMAPEESIQELLKVPLGCVTPFALINESSRSVSLLLDQGFKTQECCFFHPLLNDTTISLNSRALDKFLLSLGRNPVYVDLEATPLVGKDQPPDLAGLVPSETPSLAEIPGKEVPKQNCTENNTTVVDKSPSPAKAHAILQPREAKKVATKQSQPKVGSICENKSKVCDVRKLIDEVIEKTAAAALFKVTNEQKAEQLVSIMDEIQKRVGPDLESLMTSFKNAAYTEGFHSGVKSVALRGLQGSSSIRQ